MRGGYFRLFPTFNEVYKRKEMEFFSAFTHFFSRNLRVEERKRRNTHCGGDLEEQTKSVCLDFCGFGFSSSIPTVRTIYFSVLMKLSLWVWLGFVDLRGFKSVFGETKLGNVVLGCGEAKGPPLGLG